MAGWHVLGLVAEADQRRELTRWGCGYYEISVYNTSGAFPMAALSLSREWSFSPLFFLFRNTLTKRFVCLAPALTVKTDRDAFDENTDDYYAHVERELAEAFQTTTTMPFRFQSAIVISVRY